MCLNWLPGPCIHSRKCHNHTSSFHNLAAVPCSPHPRKEDGRAQSRPVKSTLLASKQQNSLVQPALLACWLLFYTTAAVQLISRA